MGEFNIVKGNEKNIIVTCLLIAFKNNSFAQFKQIEFTGHIKGIDAGIVELLIEPYTDTNLVMLEKKMAVLKNGIFKIRGRIKYPYPTRIVVNDSIFSTVFYVEPGKMKGDFTLDSFSNLSVDINSKVNNEYVSDYQVKAEPIQDIIDLWYEEHYKQQQTYNQKIPTTIEDSMQLLKKNLRDMKDSITYTYIISHNKSYVGLWNLLKNVKGASYNKLREKSFCKLDLSLQRTITGIKIRKILENAKRLAIGATFPKIPIMDSVYKTHILNSKLLGKYTLLDFWFSHCGPCIMEFPALKNLFAKYKNKGFQILGISVDTKSNRPDWLGVIKKYVLSWPQYWDQDALQSGKLEINFFPTNFLLDKDGKIIGMNLETRQIEIFLQENTK